MGVLCLASPYEATPLDSLKEEDIDKHFKPIAQAFLVFCKELYPVMLINTGEIKGRIIALGDWATNTTRIDVTLGEGVANAILFK